MKKVKLIGLTGGVATGKSAAARVFRRLGCTVLDTDKIAHQMIKRPDIKKKVIKIFGTVRRPQIAKIVFKDAKKRRQLERILHPAIWKEVKKRAKGLTIVEVPLLFEVGWDKKVDATIVVKCSMKEQLKRCPPEFKNRIAAQMPLTKKICKTDYIIDSNGPKAKTALQIKAVLETIACSLCFF